MAHENPDFPNMSASLGGLSFSVCAIGVGLTRYLRVTWKVPLYLVLSQPHATPSSSACYRNEPSRAGLLLKDRTLLNLHSGLCCPSDGGGILQSCTALLRDHHSGMESPYISMESCEEIKTPVLTEEGGRPRMAELSFRGHSPCGVYPIGL